MICCTIGSNLKDNDLQQKYIRISLYLVLGCVPSLLHVRLLLDRDRAWKMRQLSINCHDARMLRASLLVGA